MSNVEVIDWGALGLRLLKRDLTDSLKTPLPVCVTTL